MQAGIYGRQSQMSNTTQSLPSPLAPQVGALSPEGAHSASENTYQSLPERGASARPPRPSHARGLEGGQPLGETGTPSNRSQASFDSSRTEGDDETKAIILKAINGMRVRFFPSHVLEGVGPLTVLKYPDISGSRYQYIRQLVRRRL